MGTAKAYDLQNRLTSIATTRGSATVSSHGYTYNALGQRTRADLSDGTHWAYGYDGLGQVTSGAKRWADDSAVGGGQFAYAFDNIGNRTTVGVNGRQSAYSVNALNLYIGRTVP